MKRAAGPLGSMEPIKPNVGFDRCYRRPFRSMKNPSASSLAEFQIESTAISALEMKERGSEFARDSFNTLEQASRSRTERGSIIFRVSTLLYCLANNWRR